MRRRSVIFSGLGLTLVAALGALFWRPKDLGENHDNYFSALDSLLKEKGPGRPVMMIDIDRMNHNIDQISNSVGPEKTYRIVVKSLPSMDLLKHIMKRANTNALMVFHQPFLNAIVDAFPEADILMGKPMPITAVATFYNTLTRSAAAASQQIQWLIDTPERLIQYQQLANKLGVTMRINCELDVGLHRGGLSTAQSLDPVLDIIDGDPEHLNFSGFMGYEPHLTGLKAKLGSPSVQSVLSIYQAFINQAKARGVDTEKLTLNGAGSHTLGIYENDNLMNDLSAGSGIVKPMDFDTFYMKGNYPALFIATPILKRYDELKLPGDPAIAKLLPLWNPNMQRLYYIYGGYWKAKIVSPAGVADPIYQSTNQSPITTSNSVDLQIDDYIFLRPTQSEHVMLQFGDILVVKGDEIIDNWPVFHQTG